ncbi:MAG: hypothetical protein FWC10_10745, partial [Lentimicrobiaceae bacterium]|nr:hypothetical protein [Lentimicrobiaceae bacterium]
AAKIHFLVEKYYTFLIYFIDLKYITVIVRSDYIACHPCRLAMHDLAFIDTLYDEHYLKFSVSIFQNLQMW